MTTKRVNLNLTESIHASLEQEAERRNIPMAQIARVALAVYLRDLGYKVNARVEWGGDRRTAETIDQPAPVTQ